MKMSSRKISGGKEKASGRILVYYNKEFKICVIFPKSSENILWIKISEQYIQRTREVYIAGVYSKTITNYTR